MYRLTLSRFRSDIHAQFFYFEWKNFFFAFSTICIFICIHPSFQSIPLISRGTKDFSHHSFLCENFSTSSCRVFRASALAICFSLSDQAITSQSWPLERHRKYFPWQNGNQTALLLTLPLYSKECSQPVYLFRWLRISLRGRVRPSVYPSVCRSVPCYFQTTFFSVCLSVGLSHTSLNRGKKIATTVFLSHTELMLICCFSFLSPSEKQRKLTKIEISIVSGDFKKLQGKVQ